MKKTILFSAAVFAYCILHTANCFPQGTAINTSGNQADNSALLDVSSTSQGVLIPRMTDTERSSITNPATGLIVYQTNGTPGFYYYDGASWTQLSSAGPSSSPWTKNGSNIYPTLLADNVGVGTSSPNVSAILDVNSTTKGLLMPRMTAAQRNAIVSPTAGLQIFNTDCNIVDVYNGSCWISQGQNLKTPYDIVCSGTTDFCANESRNFTIPAVPGATNYVWHVPAGAAISSGQGTTAISVLFGNNSGSVCVIAENICETSDPACIDVHINPIPPTPGNITGLTTVYPGDNNISYFIATIPGATLYNWTVPAGCTITSGVGTSNIMVRFPCNATTDSIMVTASTNCGASPPSILHVMVNPIIAANAGPDVFGGVAVGGSPTATGGKSAYTYLWSPATNLSGTTVANPTAACAGSTTTYTVTVTDANSCTASDSTLVTRSLVAGAGSNKQYADAGCGGQIIGGSPTATGGAGSYTYNWNPATDLSDNTVANPTATPTVTRIYTVTVTDANGCTSSSSMTFTVGGSSTTFNYTGSIQTWNVPAGITCARIEAWGAQGYRSNGGKGAYIKGTFTVTPGDVIQVASGQQGFGDGTSGGGGGGSFVYNSTTSTLLIVAGGGGGGGNTSGVDASTGNDGTADRTGTNAGGTGGSGGSASGSSWYGAGGAGYLSDGANGGNNCTGGIKWNTLTGGNGGSNYGGPGGYGGGGGGTYASGGGGGYSGGGGAWSAGSSRDGGGGGGSFNSGSNQTNTAGVQTGNGKVTITY